MNKTTSDILDESILYGFNLAIQYAELAIKYDKDPVKFLKDQLDEWKAEKEEAL